MECVDIHEHLLYGIDDGPSKQQGMFDMLNAAAEQGINAIIATPHVTPGVYSLDVKQYEKALCVSREAMQKYPDNWELHYLAGMVYCSMENYERAIEYYKKAGQLGTPFCDEKYSLAWCYKKLERFKEAYHIFLEIAEIHRKNGYDIEAEQALGYAKEIEDKI